jgi:hypothetical protein
MLRVFISIKVLLNIGGREERTATPQVVTGYSGTLGPMQRNQHGHESRD